MLQTITKRNLSYPAYFIKHKTFYDSLSSCPHTPSPNVVEPRWLIHIHIIHIQVLTYNIRVTRLTSKSDIHTDKWERAKRCALIGGRGWVPRKNFAETDDEAYAALDSLFVFTILGLFNSVSSSASLFLRYSAQVDPFNGDMREMMMRRGGYCLSHVIQLVQVLLEADPSCFFSPLLLPYFLSLVVCIHMDIGTQFEIDQVIKYSHQDFKYVYLSLHTSMRSRQGSWQRHTDGDCQDWGSVELSFLFLLSFLLCEKWEW